jgi:hypothetical protein
MKHATPVRTTVAIVIVIAAALAVGDPAAQQQGPVPGRNVNVNGGPTWVTYDPSGPFFEIVGDPWRNQSVEPECDVSSRNPAIIVCSAVDYRLVDIPGGAFSSSVPPGPHPDSWNMIAQSRDGGLTWMSRPHPGFGLDTSGTALELKKYQFGADPMIRFGAAGAMLHVGLVANRGENSPSAIYSSTWIHLNNHEYDPEPVKFTGLVREIAVGSSGQFRDRPHLAMGEPDGRTCGFDVPVESFDANGDAVETTVRQDIPCTPAYVAYATFVGSGKNARSKIQFTKSYNLGRGWTQPITINEQVSIVAQGVQIVKIPNSRKIIVFWRRGATLNQTDAIMMAVSNNDGDSFSKGVRFADIYPFDQQNDATRIRFKTMANATAGPGRAYVVWSERRNPVTNQPDLLGEGRVVMASTNGSDIGGPFVVAPSATGHQIFPTVAVGPGTVHVSWMDFRNDASQIFDAQGIDEMRVVTNNPPLDPRRRHTADMFAAESKLATPFTFGEAFQVSQYVFGIFENETALKQIQWNVVLARNFNKMTIPFHGDYNASRAESMVALDPVGHPGVWGLNLGQDGMPPRTPVFHDAWTDGRNMQLLHDEDYGTPVGKRPRPYTPPSLDTILDEYGNSTIPNDGQSLYDRNLPRWDPSVPPGLSECGPEYAGTKNLDIYTARTTQGFYAFAPWNHKTLGYKTYDPEDPDKYGTEPQLVQRAFPIVVENTGDTGLRSFTLIIKNQPPGGAASFDQFGSRDTDSIFDVPPRSMAARTVFVTSSDEYAPVGIEVTDGQSTTTVFLNPDRTAPPNLLQPGEVDMPFDVSYYEVHDVDIKDVRFQDIDMQSVSGQGFDAAGGFWDEDEWMDPGWRTPGWRTPGWRTPGWRTPGWRTPGWRTADWENPGWRTADWENPGWRTEGWQEVNFSDGASSRYITAKVVSNGCKAASVDGSGNGGTRCQNTYSTHNANVLVNGADPSLDYQLIVYKVYATPGNVGCDHKLARNTQVVVNIPHYDPSPANFNTIDPRASFVLGPDEVAYVVLVGFAHGPGRAEFQDAWLPVDNVVIKVTPDAVNTDPYLDYVTCPDRPGCTPPATPPTPVPVPSKAFYVIAPAFPDGAVGTPYATEAFQVVGGTGPYTFAVSGGSLPGDVFIDPANGQLSGAPLHAGTFGFDVTVTDGTSSPPLTDTQHFTLGVAPGAGDIIVADGAPGTTGNLLSIRPDGSAGEVFAQMSSGAPHDIARSRGGELYVVVTATDTILEVSRTGAVSTIFSGTPLVHPTAIAVDSAGSVYVGDNLNDTVYQLKKLGSAWAVAKWQPLTVAPGSGQNIDLVAGGPDEVVVGYENWNGSSPGTTGTYIERIDFGTNPPTTTPILSPGKITAEPMPHQLTGLAIDAEGAFIVTDQDDSTLTAYPRAVYKVASDGSSATLVVWGLNANPSDVEVDAAGDYIVSSNGVGGAPALVRINHAPPYEVTEVSASPWGMTYPNSVAIVDDVFITTGALADAVGGTPYTQTLAARGGTAPYTWTVTSGSLPAGLNLDSSLGTISGIPTQGGVFTFTVSANDANSPPLVDTRVLAILVEVDMRVDLRLITASPYYTIGVRVGSRNTTATGVTLRTDPLPSGVVYEWFQPGDCPRLTCRYNPGPRILSCSLAGWTGDSCEMRVGVSFSLMSPTFGLGVRANEPDPDSSNNHSMITIGSPGPSPLALKGDPSDPAQAQPIVLPRWGAIVKPRTWLWPTAWLDHEGLK